jgi:hypothetical protein
MADSTSVHIEPDPKRLFRGALEAWASAVLARGIPTEVFIGQRRVWEKTEQNTMMPRDVPDATWSVKFSVESMQLPEWKAAEETARAWTPLARHMGHLIGCKGRNYMRGSLGMLTRPFIPEPTYDQTKNAIVLPVFDAQQFADLFECFASFVESDTLTYISKTVLVGLRIEAHHLPLRLSEVVSIQALSRHEVQTYGDMGLIQAPFMGPKDLYEWTGLPWLVAVWSDVMPKVFKKDAASTDFAAPSRAEDLQHVLQSVLGALAITRFGSVGLGGGTTRISGWQFGGISLTRPKTSVPEFTPNPARHMQLNDSDRNMLQQIFPAVFRRRSETDALGIAQRRLTHAMEDELDEDRLLDDMIAAEAIFGDRESKTEIKFKFALRSAYILAPDDPQLRRRIFEDMKSAYDVRSDIVHGSKPKENKHKIGGKPVQVSAFVQAIEDYIRTALRMLVLSSDSAVPPRWDDMIVGASLPSAF